MVSCPELSVHVFGVGLFCFLPCFMCVLVFRVLVGRFLVRVVACFLRVSPV